MNQKKINIFLVILILILISLNAISASNDTQCSANDLAMSDNLQSDNSISDISDVQKGANYNSNADNSIDTDANKIIDKDISSNITKKDKNIKTESKMIKVNNYGELHAALTDDSYSNLTIELQGDKKYTITERIEIDYNIRTLNINANNRIIDGVHKYSFIKTQNEFSRINISNIQVINCNDSLGGVIYNRAFLTIVNSSFINNTATEGGVIYNYKSLTIDNCTFENNNGGSRGGVISSHRTLRITNSRLKNSTATNGGSLYLYGNTNTTIENNTITDSSANFAGSIFNYGTGNLSVVNNNITCSTARIYGGVLLNHGASICNISRNNISNSRAQWGAVVVSLADVNITENNFHNNTADYGGVIFNWAQINLNDNNFTENNAGIGGCIYNSAECTIEVRNNNFDNNTADDGAVIYNSGECIFNNNNVTSNRVTANDAYVIKSDEDVINDDAEHKMEIRNNKFINNTDYKRDMLIYNNATTTISNNTYTGNYLDLNISSLENLSYVDEVNTILNVKASDRYNTTLNTGNVLLNVNGKDYRFSIKNNASNIHLNSSQLLNQNTIKISYTDNDKSFNSQVKTCNVSVYKNTMISIKTDKTVKYRDILKINVNVTDLDKKIVDKGYVIYKINGITLTDASGLIKSNIRNKTITLDYQLPKNFNIKDYTLEVIYSGNPNNYNVSRNSTKFTIVKTSSVLTVTCDKKTAKMDEKVKFTARINSDYKINEGVMIFKVNGVTVKDKNNKAIVVNVTDNTATVTFTIPDGWSAKPVKVTAVYSNKNFDRLENDTYFNITKTTPKFNISSVKLTTNSIRVKGKLVDSYGHYVSGVNTIVIKINSLTIKNENNKPQVFVVSNGVIDIDYTLLFTLKKNEYKLEFVTGQRNAYTDSRLTMNVKNY